MARVTIIVPNFNHARFLESRLQSIVTQTYQDFELLLLDDASTDGSDGMLERFAHQRNCRFLRNQENSGSAFAQWNKGVALSETEFVWIAESDDVAEPALLERLVRCLDEHPGAVLSYCQSTTISEKGIAMKVMDEWTNDLDASRWKRDFVNDGRDELSRFMILKNTIPNASAVVFRRAAFSAAGGAFAGMRICGDWLLWAAMLTRGEVAFVAEALNGFRVHEGTVRSVVSRQRFFDESLETQITILNWIGSAADESKLRRKVRENWWLAIHHSNPKAGWSWMLEMVKKSLQLSLLLAVQLLVMALAARLLRTGAGKVLLEWKRNRQCLTTFAF